MDEQTFRSFRESKRSRNFEELMALETNFPGGVEVNTEEAKTILKNNPRVEKLGNPETGRVEKYYIGTKIFTWTSKANEIPPSIQVAEAA